MDLWLFDMQQFFFKYIIRHKKTNIYSWIQHLNGSPPHLKSMEGHSCRPREILLPATLLGPGPGCGWRYHVVRRGCPTKSYH